MQRGGHRGSSTVSYGAVGRSTLPEQQQAEMIGPDERYMRFVYDDRLPNPLPTPAPIPSAKDGSRILQPMIP